MDSNVTVIKNGAQELTFIDKGEEYLVSLSDKNEMVVTYENCPDLWMAINAQLSHYASCRTQSAAYDEEYNDEDESVFFGKTDDETVFAIGSRDGKLCTRVKKSTHMGSTIGNIINFINSKDMEKRGTSFEDRFKTPVFHR